MASASMPSVYDGVGSMKTRMTSQDNRSGEALALLAKARAGDTAALGTLLEQYRGYLTLLARTQIGRRLQGKADAADLVQETFLQVHQHITGFRGTSQTENNGSMHTSGANWRRGGIGDRRRAHSFPSRYEFLSVDRRLASRPASSYAQ